MRWISGEATTPEAEPLAHALAAQLGLSAPVGRALWARKIRDAESAARFLSPQLSHLPDPFGLKGIEAAVERMQRALELREAITVYGDYDVDGVTSTVLLVSTLRRFAACAPGVEAGVTHEALGAPSGLPHTQAQGRAAPARVDFYVPHRLIEGYGLNLEAMGKLAARGTRLVVSADCGVTAVAEVEGAARLGLDVVVIDHHTAAQRSEDLPKAIAILNPHQPGCDFPGRELAAVGVAFHLLLALRKRLREAGWFAGRTEPNLREALDLVALGTVADVVPLTGPNRVLVHFGLKELSRAARPGVLALKSVAGVAGDVTAGDVGFKLGPRINAAGRLEDAAVAVKLLLSDDLGEARRLAEELDRSNNERQELQGRISEEALVLAAKLGSPAERRAIIVSAPGWHAGVVGIVASRLVERLHRPALVLVEEDGVAKGSGRSIEGFHLYDALAACSSFLSRFGGHKHAAGLTLDLGKLAAFSAAFEEHARKVLDPSQLEPRVRIDALLQPHELTIALAHELQRLAPFGAGNPEPVFACEGLSATEVRVIKDKRGSGPGHLKLKVTGGKGAPVDAIGFSMGSRALVSGSALGAAFQLGVDTWSGVEKVQLKLKDVRVG